MTETQAKEASITKKVWQLADIMAGAGVGFTDYLTQLTYLLFLKMDRERVEFFLEASAVPDGYRWEDLLKETGEDLLDQYEQTLDVLSRQHGLVGTIFTKAANRIESPVYLEKLISFIDQQQWLLMDGDVKGALYESILQKNGQDKKSGAGQYFTPRPLVDAIVDVVNPKIGETVADPACGTGGFLACAFDHVKNKYVKSVADHQTLQQQIHGVEKKQLPHLLATTNMLLHGIEVPVQIRHDNTLNKPLSSWDEQLDVIVTNPPLVARKKTVLRRTFRQRCKPAKRRICFCN